MATSKKDSMTAVAKKANRDYPLAESPNPSKFFGGISGVIGSSRANRGANISAKADLERAKGEKALAKKSGRAEVLRAKADLKRAKRGM